jgi:hypothetical protein
VNHIRHLNTRTRSIFGQHGPTIHQLPTVKNCQEELPLEFSTIRMKKTKTEIEKGDVDSVQ